MNTPEWLKPGIYGAVIGAVFVGVVGFSWGGWVTGGTSNDRAMAMSRTMSSPPWYRSASTWRGPTRLGRTSLQRSGPPRPTSGATRS
jgi:hypothetical protein